MYIWCVVLTIKNYVENNNNRNKEEQNLKKLEYKQHMSKQAQKKMS